jgi:hypothetical protein
MHVSSCAFDVQLIERHCLSHFYRSKQAIALSITGASKLKSSSMVNRSSYYW